MDGRCWRGWSLVPINNFATISILAKLLHAGKVSYPILTFLYLRQRNPSPKVMDPIILYIFLKLVTLWRYGNLQFRFCGFLQVVSWYILLYLLFILQYVHIVRTICAILRFIFLYLWLLSSRKFCLCDQLVMISLID